MTQHTSALFASSPLAIDVVLGVVVFWFVLGLLGIAVRHNARLISNLVFPAGAAASLLLAVTALLAIGGASQVAILPLGLPDLPFHLRLDALAAFFLFLLGAVAAGVSIFSGNASNSPM